jgi:hypothetical protein
MSGVATRLELVEAVPPEVPVGARVTLKVRVSGADARDLRGGCVNVMAAEEILATQELIERRDDADETAAFVVTAPDRVGAFTWSVIFPAQEIGGVVYAESTLPVVSQTRPHRTSLAVWAIPSPVLIAERFTITVGAKSAGGCALGGAKVEILDYTGAMIGDGVLGDTPWPGTDALYWTQITLAAPPRDGMYSWRAAFAGTECKVPHDGSSGAFSFAAVRRPEHRLTVKVIESGTAAPMENVHVALGPFRAATDGAGLAHIETPGGTFDLAVWKPGFAAAPIPVEIAADTSVQVEMACLPEELTVWD